MNRSELIFKRLQNQRLSASKLADPAEVVRWLGAVQAQDFNAAKWALALRMSKATNAAIDDAFNKGQILRAHVMRPTWHFVAPEDIRWLLQLTAPRVNLRAGPNYRKFELDAALFKRSNRIFTKALEGGKYLTRAALKSILDANKINVTDPVRLAHILLRAELDAVICSGPRIGKQFTYALLEERASATKTFNRDEALAELTQRYFRSHGPATLQDFVWWSGLTVEDAKRGIAQVGNPRSARTKQSSPNLAHLLPAFDEYFVAYKDRQIVAGSLSTWDVLGPTFIINGIAAGTWKRTDSGIVEFNASRTLNKQESLALKKATDRYLTFLS
jgi:hypothetical protein